MRKPISIDSRTYQEILICLKAIFKKQSSKAMPLHVNPWEKQQLLGWHLLLSQNEATADYFVLYDTELFDSIAQIRFLRGEYQLQYTLEPNTVILLSQFKLSGVADEYDEWSEGDFKDKVINIGQPISEIEAKGLLLQLRNRLESGS